MLSNLLQVNSIFLKTQMLIDSLQVERFRRATLWIITTRLNIRRTILTTIPINKIITSTKRWCTASESISLMVASLQVVFRWKICKWSTMMRCSYFRLTPCPKFSSRRFKTRKEQTIASTALVSYLLKVLHRIPFLNKIMVLNLW